MAIVTPNHMHAGPTYAFLKAGIHVICDKPLTVSLAEARKMKAAVEKSGLIFELHRLASSRKMSAAPRPNPLLDIGIDHRV